MGLVQLIGPLIRFADIGLQIRVGSFFLGQLKPGGWPVCGGLSLGGGSLGLFCGFLGFVPVMGSVNTFQQLVGVAACLRGKICFCLPAGNVLHLAGGLIFQRQAVAGHGLRYLGLGFQLFHGESPPLELGRVIRLQPRLTGSS